MTPTQTTTYKMRKELPLSLLKMLAAALIVGIIMKFMPSVQDMIGTLSDVDYMNDMYVTTRLSTYMIAAMMLMSAIALVISIVFMRGYNNRNTVLYYVMMTGIWSFTYYDVGEYFLLNGFRYMGLYTDALGTSVIWVVIACRNLIDRKLNTWVAMSPLTSEALQARCIARIRSVGTTRFQRILFYIVTVQLLVSLVPAGYYTVLGVYHGVPFVYEGSLYGAVTDVPVEDSLLVYSFLVGTAFSILLMAYASVAALLDYLTPDYFGANMQVKNYIGRGQKAWRGALLHTH